MLFRYTQFNRFCTTQKCNERKRLANFGILFNLRLLACDWDEQEMSNVSGSCECYSHILKPCTYQNCWFYWRCCCANQADNVFVDLIQVHTYTYTRARRVIAVCSGYGHSFDISYQPIILIRSQRHTTYILENFNIRILTVIETDSYRFKSFWRGISNHFCSFWMKVISVVSKIFGLYFAFRRTNLSFFLSFSDTNNGHLQEYCI